MLKVMEKNNDVIKAMKRANREIQFLRNGGGQFVSTNRVHKNKKKYDRKRDRKVSLSFFIYLPRL